MFNIDNTVLHENQPTKRVKSYFVFFFFIKNIYTCSRKKNIEQTNMLQTTVTYIKISRKR